VSDAEKLGIAREALRKIAALQLSIVSGDANFARMVAQTALEEIK
jgi:hypothetical protein